MTAPLPQLAPAEEYRAIADRFAATVRGTADWDAPTPVVEWRARDVVDHLVTWLPAVIEDGSEVRFTPGPSAAEDPVRAWTHLDEQIRRILADPEVSARPHSNRHTGQDRPVGAVIDEIFTGDVFFHTWDLARSSGQDDRLDPDMVHEALTGMSAMEEYLRPTGQFGQQQPVPEDATEQERLFAFLGRDPRWAPPGSGQGRLGLGS
ncbi:TIGR03086 family metal-binding protein [Brachybacterium kimchii]|uniref:TIGR03086 family metal-binding protein n=1 Tax=Brachybacterium kimchii TaxID=2942909 RepID=A0ABY4N4E8_9MICO|nr:TIGR03086 family metal-binding protein [Brachybacterium kimchii]UQN29019.1 TIGR03086 family metal-binding protein [Brachybacterium kimchii]